MEVDTQERPFRTKNQRGMFCNPSSSSSSSAAAITKTPHCVSLKKIPLARRGYESFEDWQNSNPNHLYIGRGMFHFVPGAVASKWENPFKPLNGDKKSLEKCLERYEDRVRRTPDLFNALMELEGLRS